MPKTNTILNTQYLLWQIQYHLEVPFRLCPGIRIFNRTKKLSNCTQTDKTKLQTILMCRRIQKGIIYPCPLGGYGMHKPLATTKKHSPAAGHNYKKSSQTKKIQFRPRLSALGLIYCFLGVWGIQKSLGSNILGRNWKSMWKPYTGSIFDFLQKFFFCHF